MRHSGRQELRRSRCVDDVRPLEIGAEVLPERRSAESVEPDRAEHDGDEREHPRRPLRAGEARERHPQHEPAFVLAERRNSSEQPEVDGEAVAVVVPRPPAVGRHPEPHRVAVERDCECERARARRLRVGELERREQGESDRAGPDAEPPRVVERRRPVLAESTPEPGDAVGDREPWVQHPPDVAEQHLQRHEPEPEDDVDEGRCEVLGRGRLADQRGQEDERRADRRRGRPRSRGAASSGAPAPARAAAASRRRDGRIAASSRARRARGTRRRGRSRRPRRRATRGPAGP